MPKVINANLLFCVIFFCASNCEAQKLSVPALINDLYKKDIQAERIDTVLFLNFDSNDFFMSNINNARPIKIVTFYSKDSLRNFVKLRKVWVIFKANIQEIGPNKIRLKIGLYKSENSDSRDQEGILFVIDSRTIICTLSKGEWRLNKTIAIENN